MGSWCNSSFEAIVTTCLLTQNFVIWKRILKNGSQKLFIFCNNIYLSTLSQIVKDLSALKLDMFCIYMDINHSRFLSIVFFNPACIITPLPTTLDPIILIFSIHAILSLPNQYPFEPLLPKLLFISYLSQK